MKRPPIMATAVVTLIAQARAANAEEKLQPVVIPTITRPTVTAPSGPMTTRPKVPAQTAVPVGIRAFDEAAYKTASDGGRAVVLVFTRAGDPTSIEQATALQTVLRESEFRELSSFQIEVSNAGLGERFQVTKPSTVLVMKAGVERLRSAGLTDAEALRKMLRLTSAL